MIQGYRLIDRDYLKTAFTGKGAKEYGGRWNSPGTAMIYASTHASLAALEVLVHLEDVTVLEAHWMLIPFEIPRAQVLEVAPDNGLSTDFATPHQAPQQRLAMPGPKAKNPSDYSCQVPSCPWKGTSFSIPNTLDSMTA